MPLVTRFRIYKILNLMVEIFKLLKGEGTVPDSYHVCTVV